MFVFFVYPIILAFLMMFCSMGFGISFGHKLSPAGRVLSDFSSGLGIVSFIIFFIGLSGGLYSYVMASVMVIGLGLFSLKVLRKRYLFDFRDIKKRMCKPRYLFFLLLMAVYFLWISASIYMPCFMDDPQNYHLSVPQEYLKAHRIFYMFWNLHSNMPFLGQMSWMPLLSLSSPAACKMFMIIQYGFMGLATYLIGRKVLSRGSALFAVFLFYSFFGSCWMKAPVFLNNDITMGFFHVSMVFWLVNYSKFRSLKAACMVGLLLGFALCTKYFSILFGIPLVCLFFFISLFRESWKIQLAHLLAALTIAITVFSPWLIKQYVYTGDPIYPIAYSRFATNLISIYAAERRTLYTEKGDTGTVVDRIAVSESKSSVLLTRIIKERLMSIQNNNDILYPFGFLCVCILLLLRRRLVFAYALMGFYLYFASMILGGIQWHRYFSIHYPLITIIVAYCACYLFRIRLLIRILFAVVIFLNLIYTQYVRLANLNVRDFFPRQEKEVGCFYEDLDLNHYYSLVQYVNTRIPSGNRVLVYPYIFGANFERPVILPCRDSNLAVYHYFWKNMSSQESLDRLRKENVQYIVFSFTYIQPMMNLPQIRKAVNFCHLNLELVQYKQGLYVYRIPSSGEIARKERLYKQNTSVDHFHCWQ